MNNRELFLEELAALEGDKWPEDKQKATEVGRTLFGVMLMASADSNLEYWKDIIFNPSMPGSEKVNPRSDEWDKQQELRSMFSELADKQRVLIYDSFRRAVSSMLHSILARYEQFPFADLEIILRCRDTQKIIEVSSASLRELKYEHSDWKKKFSQELS